MARVRGLFYDRPMDDDARARQPPSDPAEPLPAAAGAGEEKPRPSPEDDPIDSRPHLPAGQSFLTLPGTRDLYRARRWR